MKYLQRSHRDLSGAARPRALVSALTLALAAGGCSADVGRFDHPSFNLNGDTGTTSALPTPSEPVGSQGPSLSGGQDSYSGNTYAPSSSRSTDRVELGALPESSGPATSPPSYRQPTYQPRTAYRAPEPAPTSIAGHRSAGPAPASGTIEVQRGDTLYSLARANNVTVNELMAANGLSSPMIRPGQTLRLPGSNAVVAAPHAPPSASRRSVAAAPERAASHVAVADWNGSYQVQTGDSLYRIARRHDVRIADLQRANGITNPRALKPGMTLRVPGQGDGTSHTAEVAPVPGATAEPEVARSIPSSTQPTLLNGEERRVASLDTGRATDATPPAVSTAPVKPVKTAAITPSGVAMSSLRWPAKGKVLSGFGQRPDGTHNDGVNIAVPKGTEVHAAAEGEVAYAGSELKGYGNLILLRHDNGWVTAYAHADQILVQRGDKVRRGDVIAKAGNSGQVDQPQVHFELRQGSKPVDPLPYLDRL